MSSNTITKLYDQLSSMLGKEPAQSLLSYIELKVREETKDKVAVLEALGELAEACTELATDIRERQRVLWRWLLIMTSSQLVLICCELFFHFKK